MNINDEKIKNIIARFKRGEESLLSEILDEIALYVYNYPKAVYNACDDTCSDFYEYILSNFKRILKNYEIGRAKFSTWLTVVLRTRYLNFLKLHRRDDKNSEVSLDLTVKSNTGLYNLLGDTRSYSDVNSSKFDRLIDEIVSKLSDSMRFYFHAFYADIIRPEDVRFISIYLNVSIMDVLIGLNKIKYDIEVKRENRAKIESRLSASYGNIIMAQRQKQKNDEKSARKTQNRLLNEYSKARMNPSYEVIAELCGYPVGTVAAGISRMKRAVRGIVERYKLLD